MPKNGDSQKNPPASRQGDISLKDYKGIIAPVVALFRSWSLSEITLEMFQTYLHGFRHYNR